MIFAGCDRTGKILKIAQINAAKAYARRPDLIQDPKELFSRRMQDRNDRFTGSKFHTRIL